MLENWCWSSAEIISLSHHYKTGEKMPQEIVDTIIKTKHVNDALFNLRQLHFAYFDMEMHNLKAHEDAKKISPSVEYNKLRTEISLLDPPQENKDVCISKAAPVDSSYSSTDTLLQNFGHGEATFGHLMGGYDAGYYGYLWFVPHISLSPPVFTH